MGNNAISPEDTGLTDAAHPWLAVAPSHEHPTPRWPSTFSLYNRHSHPPLFERQIMKNFAMVGGFVALIAVFSCSQNNDMSPGKGGGGSAGGVAGGRPSAGTSGASAGSPNAGAGGSSAAGTTGGGTGGSSSGAGGKGTSPGSNGDKPSTDTTWSQSLTAGPNGPIPLIVVDQFGYRPVSKKVAVIRDPQTGYDSGVNFTPGARYAVVDKATGKPVKEGAPASWNGGATDTSSGDKAWWFDFSDVTTPGTYTVVDQDKNVRSVEFDIRDDVYLSPLKHTVRAYHYQRAGFAKSAANLGSDWADGVDHAGTNQDSQAHAWTAKTDAAQVKDLHGGWYDAGDFNKYSAWGAGYVILLLRAFQEYPKAFGDDFGIAESGNGIPDLLDEVKWELDWLVRMQNSDGSVLCVMQVASGSPPSAATEPSYYGPATTNASLMTAAAFAYASKIYGAQGNAGLKTFAADLAARAAKAWQWAAANPKVTYFNNDDSKQAGSSGLAAGQQETDDTGRLFSKFQAAVYLYEITGEATYKTFAESNYASIVSGWGPNQWDMERQEILLYYAKLDGITANVGTTIINKFVTNMTKNGDQLPMVAGDQDPYRAPMKDYTWGSNQSKAAQARLYQLLAKFGSGNDAKTAAAAGEEYVHYVDGVNPLGLVYLTNMQQAGAEHSAKTMFHSWFADKSRWDEKPAPGFLVGGPNPSFELDSCCTAASGTSAYQCYGSTDFALCSASYAPPLQQPAQKAYLQFNSSWPANSWSVTEPSMGYQAKYVLVLAAYAN
jgi:hypothetical protein